MRPFVPLLLGLTLGLAGAGGAVADPRGAGPAPTNAAVPAGNGGGDSLGAGWRQQQDEVRQGVRQRRLMPLADIIDRIRARAAGRQLDAGLEVQGDRQVYRVRWMTTDGRRIDYIIDAVTGAILSGQ